MGKQISINSIVNSTESYNVYICDTTLLTCVYLITINDSDIPYTITVPSPYDTMSQFTIKIVDANGCEIIKTF